MRRCKRHIATRRMAGHTLIELMLAATIGAVLLAGVGVLFVELRQSSRVERALGQIQQQGGYGLNQLTRTVRMAGFQGCGAEGDFKSTLAYQSSGDKVQKDDTIYGTDQPLAGYYVDGSGNWNGTTAPSEFDHLNVKNNSDLLIIRGVDNSSSAEIDKQPGNPSGGPGSAALHTRAQENYDDCDIVVAMNCPSVAQFQVTGLNKKGKWQHNTGMSCSGESDVKNYTKDLGHNFEGGTLARYTTRVYYMGWNSDDANPGLYEYDAALDQYIQLTAGPSSALELTYGVDTGTDQQVDQYNGAATVESNGNWSSVLSIRVAMLASSKHKDVTTSSGQQSLTFNGKTYGGDGRLYRVFRTTVGIRNRLP